MKTNLQTTLKESSENLREIVHSMIETRRKAENDNLPSVPDGLEPLLSRLNKIDFTLVVSGEVNRGKSTFINALIGQEILPTYDKETTSQVFKVINSEKELYNIVYSNGDRKPIVRDELEKYGTQVNQCDTMNKDELPIFYIEVCIPIRNLPMGVNIVDTPGIGSVYAQHTEIAKGFMQQADAIIYLCSARHPLVRVDIDFIKENVLNLPTSPNVLFIMGKSDLVDSEEAMNDLLGRCETQLNENFNENASIQKRVIPVNNLALVEANKCENDATAFLRTESNIDEVIKEIDLLIERQKFCWLISLYNSAVRYYKLINAFLEKCISGYDLDESSRQERLKNLADKIRRFEKDFGKDSQRTTLEGINGICRSLRDELIEQFTPQTSTILKKYISEVDMIESSASEETINHKANELTERLLKETTEKWEQLSSEALSQIYTELIKYHKNCRIIVGEEFNIEAQDTDIDINLEISSSDYLQAIKGEYMTGNFLTVVSVLGLSALAANSPMIAGLLTTGGILAGPVAWISLGVGAVAYGLIFGAIKAKRNAVKRAKSEINEHLSNVLSEVKRSLTKTSLMNGRHESVLELFRKKTIEDATTSMESVYEETYKELRAIEKELTNSTNQANRTKVVNQQTLFNRFAKQLQNLTESLKSINSEFEQI